MSIQVDDQAELTFYRLGKHGQVLISDNAMYDAETGQLDRHSAVRKYIDMTHNVHAEAFALLKNYIRLTQICDDGTLNPLFLNATNIEMVVTLGEGDRRITTVHMNYADVTYDVLETAQQICWAGDGYVNDYDEDAGRDMPTQLSAPPSYIYPLPDVDVTFDDVEGTRKVEFNNVAAIEHHFNWPGQLLTILPYPITMRSEYIEGELYHGYAELRTTRAQKANNPSYIYPVDIK